MSNPRSPRSRPRWQYAAAALLAAVFATYVSTREEEGIIKSIGLENSTDTNWGGEPEKQSQQQQQLPQPQHGEGRPPLEFAPERLRAVRTAARALVDLLDGYYGGPEKSDAMLQKSWQAPWNFDAPPTDDNAANVVAAIVEGRVEGKGEEMNVGEMKNASDGVDGDLDERRRLKKKRTKHKTPAKRDGASEAAQTAYARRRADKLVQVMGAALLSPSRTKFVIGTIGSSVAAGHDNCHYDSYESQLERTFAPVWEAAGMVLEVQNAGEGGGCGDTQHNQVYCVTHNLSPDADVVHYSWTYFEKEDAHVQREQLVRWAQRMPRRPPVHHLYARGNKGYCENSKFNHKLDDQYAHYGYNVFCIQTGLYAGGHDYDQEQSDGVNRFGWQHIGDGYHNTTRYGENEADEDRKKSLGAVYRNWHPGPLGFQIAADAFAHVYATSVLKALDLIEEDMNKGSDPRDRWFTYDAGGGKGDGGEEEAPSFRLPPVDYKKDMPHPHFCDPEYCVVDKPPSCLNFELPTFGSPGSTMMRQANWTVWHAPNNLWNMVGRVDKKVFQNRGDKEMCRHLDSCGAVLAETADAGRLEFRLPPMEVGLIIVCACCAKKAGRDMLLNNTNLEITFEGRTLDLKTFDLFPNQKCVRVLPQFPDTPAGGSQRRSLLVGKDGTVLTFEIKGNETKEVKISHLITL